MPTIEHSALGHILWFVGMVASVFAVLVTVGDLGLTNMFPEGQRWWQWPSRVAALALFAAFVLFHPFGA